MSREFITAFFPDMVSFLSQHWIWEELFPQDQLCEEDAFDFNSFRIRWPFLILFSFVGVTIGSIGFFTINKAHWRWAFFFFGCMNTSAILCHNLSPLKGSIFGISWYDLVRIDCGFTGASSLNLLLSQFNNGNNFMNNLLALISGMLVVSLPFIGEMFHLPFTNELTYLGITLLASIVLFFRLPSRTSRAVQLIYFGGLLSISGVLFDRMMCTFIGPRINAIHLTFLGCDIAFVGMLLMNQQMDQRNKRKKN